MLSAHPLTRPEACAKGPLLACRRHAAWAYSMLTKDTTPRLTMLPGCPASTAPSSWTCSGHGKQARRQGGKHGRLSATENTPACSQATSKQPRTKSWLPLAAGGQRGRESPAEGASNQPWPSTGLTPAWTRSAPRPAPSSYLPNASTCSFSSRYRSCSFFTSLIFWSFWWVDIGSRWSLSRIYVLEETCRTGHGLSGDGLPAGWDPGCTALSSCSGASDSLCASQRGCA